MNNYFVYIILCENDSFYTGITNDLIKRFDKHKKRKGANYTKMHKPLKYISVWEVENINSALKIEYYIKTKSKNIKIAYGGKERQDSIYNGLKLIDSRCEIVLIHDGARPFVSNIIINNSIKTAREKKAVVVGMPVKDTIKFVDNGNIKDTPNRENLWSAQTPQSFEYKLIMRAYEEAYKHHYYGTDDSMLVEKIGQKVTMIMGSYDNIKITSPEDIGIGEQILNLQRNL